MFNIWIWLGLVCIVPLMYVVLANETKFKKNIAVGVTLPYEARQDAEILACLKRFKKRLGLVSIGLILLAAVCNLVEKMGTIMVLLMVWIDLAVVLPMVPYVLCNRELKAIKARRGWRRSDSGGIAVDASVIEPGKPLSVWWFALPMAASLLPLAWNREMWLLYVVDAFFVVLMGGCFRWCYRNKDEQVDADRERTAVLTRVRRNSWKKMWLIAAWYMPLMGLGLSLSAAKPLWSAVVMILLTVGMIAAAMYIEFSLRRVQEKLTAQSGREWYVDEDDFWLGGMFYYNPNDSRLMINNRVGTNSSVNLAKPAGKVIAALLVLMLLALPFFGTVTGGESAMALTVNETALTASHSVREYVIQRENIVAVKQMETLPKGLVRTMGTGLPNLLKGTFSAPELGTVKLCLDPTCPPFLLVEESDGDVYLFGTRDASHTRQVYKELCE